MRAATDADHWPAMQAVQIRRCGTRRGYQGLPPRDRVRVISPWWL